MKQCRGFSSSCFSFRVCLEHSFSRSGASHQERATVSHIPVTSFSQTDLFLVCIYHEFRRGREQALRGLRLFFGRASRVGKGGEQTACPQVNSDHRRTSVTKHGLNFYFFFFTYRYALSQTETNLSRGKRKPKNRPVSKNAVAQARSP